MPWNQSIQIPYLNENHSETTKEHSFYINRMKKKKTKSLINKQSIPKSVLTLLLCKCPRKCQSMSCGSCRQTTPPPQKKREKQTIRNLFIYSFMTYQLKMKMKKQFEWDDVKKSHQAAPEELSRRFLGRSFRRSIGDQRRRVGESWKRVWSSKPPRPGFGRVWCRLAPPPAAHGASPTGAPRRPCPLPPPEKPFAEESDWGALWIIIGGRSENKWSSSCICVCVCWGGTTTNTRQKNTKRKK